MTSFSTLGKRKERARASAETVLETRVVFENIWATPVIEFPASSAATLQELFEAIQEAHPIAKQSSIIPSQPLKAPLFLLQEARYKNINRRFESLLLLSFEDAQQYQDWYIPCVLMENAQMPETLRVEVHLRSDQIILRETEMEQEGQWGQKRYIPLDYESMAVDRDEEHEWVVAEKDRGQKSDGSRRPVRKEAWSTYEWFPRRKTAQEHEERKADMSLEQKKAARLEKKARREQESGGDEMDVEQNASGTEQKELALPLCEVRQFGDEL